MFRLKTLFGFGLSMVFDGDDNDANNTNADGGKTDDGKESGGGDGGGKKTDNKPETHIVNVGGEDRSFTLEELKEHTSKVAAADKSFRDGAEAKKAAERGIRVESLVKTISKNDNPSEADVLELAGLLEINPKEFMQILHEEESPQKNDKKDVTAPDFDTQIQKAFGASSAEVRAILEHSTSRHVKDARKEIREISDKAVDKDEIIGKMIVDEDKDEIVLQVKDMVAEDVLRKIQDGLPFGADMVTASVQRVRSQLTKLGIPKKLNQQPIVLGLVPSEGLSSEVQADEPIKRISSTDDPNEDNLIERYLQKAVHAARRIK